MPRSSYYHSTFAERLDTILQEGLRPDIEPLYPDIAPGIYLSTSIDDAKWYAENYLEQTGEEAEIAILKVSGLQKSALERDPYEDTPGVKSYRYMEIVHPKNIKVVERYWWPEEDTE